MKQSTDEFTRNILNDCEKLNELRLSHFMAVLMLVNQDNKQFEQELKEALADDSKQLKDVDAVILKYLNGRTYRNTTTGNFLTRDEMLKEWTDIYGEPADTNTEAWREQYIDLEATNE